MSRVEIDAAVFDIGGVLIDWHPDRVYAELIPDPAERQLFFRKVCSPEWVASWDAGAPLDDACVELAQCYPQYEEQIRAWSRQDEMVAGEVPGTAGIVEQLKRKGVSLFLLTNMPVDVFEARAARFHVFRHFDGAVVSGAEGVLKPDPRIFSILIDRYRLDVGRSVFIDDSAVNVAAAEALGFRGHLFRSAQLLRTELA